MLTRLSGFSNCELMVEFLQYYAVETPVKVKVELKYSSNLSNFWVTQVSKNRVNLAGT